MRPVLGYQSAGADPAEACAPGSVLQGAVGGQDPRPHVFAARGRSYTSLMRCAPSQGVVKLWGSVLLQKATGRSILENCSYKAAAEWHVRL
jgi:hypothetical protein